MWRAGPVVSRLSSRLAIGAIVKPVVERVRKDCWSQYLKLLAAFFCQTTGDWVVVLWNWA